MLDSIARIRYKKSCLLYYSQLYYDDSVPKYRVIRKIHSNVIFFSFLTPINRYRCLDIIMMVCDLLLSNYIIIIIIIKMYSKVERKIVFL